MKIRSLRRQSPQPGASGTPIARATGRLAAGLAALTALGALAVLGAGPANAAGVAAGVASSDNSAPQADLTPVDFWW